MSASCPCVSLSQMQALMIADGDLAPDDEAMSALRELEGRQLIRRCPAHPGNWRITAEGLAIFQEAAA